MPNSLVWAVIGIDLLLFACLLLAVLWRRRRSARAPPPPPPPQPQRRDFVIVDVNNVRGGRRFDRDVDEAVAGLVCWASSLPGRPAVVLAVDHGPQACTYALEGTRCLVCFAGPNMEADDTIVCSTYFCARRAEPVALVSSDSNLRLRCAAAVANPPKDGIARPVKRGGGRLSYLPRDGASLPAAGVLLAPRPGEGAEQQLLRDIVGPAPLSAKASAALRYSRRERSGIKSELTSMRVTQAETLFHRLEQSRFASLVAGPAPPDAEPLIAHAAWLNDLEALEATRRRLGAEMRGYWDAQVFPKSERVEAE